MSFDLIFFLEKKQMNHGRLFIISAIFQHLDGLYSAFMSKASQQSTRRVRSLLQLCTSPLPMTGTGLEAGICPIGSMHGIFWINPLNQDANSSSPPGFFIFLVGNSLQTFHLPLECRSGGIRVDFY